MAHNSLEGSRCVVMFGKTQVGSLGVTVVARLRNKHVCIEQENARVQDKGSSNYLGKIRRCRL